MTSSLIANAMLRDPLYHIEYLTASSYTKYLTSSPPAHAVVLSLDEKSQIQALVTHDYIRNGTTTLLAALDTFDGTVIGQCMQRHRHQEFLRFLNCLERDIPAGRLIHVILDNYGSHTSTALSQDAEVGVKWNVQRG